MSIFLMTLFIVVCVLLIIVVLLLAVGIVMYFRPAPTMVAAPVFMPADQNITEPVNVSIHDATKDANIYYTTDGSDPVMNATNSTLYDGPFRVKPGTTIRARAYLTNMLPSETARAYYGPAPASQPESGQTTQPESAPAELPATVPAG